MMITVMVHTIQYNSLNNVVKKQKKRVNDSNSKQVSKKVC